MKKLVIAIVAVLAIFTFIREYTATAPQGIKQAQIETIAPN
jgi:FlaG/FlaF family flagellin (archaellin)